MDDVLRIVDGWLTDARLADGGEWLPAAETTSFDDRTYGPEDFRYHVDLACAIRRVQRFGDDERLLLAAWSGERWGFVVQATDAPTTAYGQAVRFDLLLEQPYGEWLDEQEVWATTMEDGTTIVLGAHDFPPGAFAKAWQSAWPPLPDGEPSLDAERQAIATLKAIGNQGVTIAEEAEPGAVAGAVMFVTPTGQLVVATVAPVGSTDPGEPWLSGVTTTEERDGVELFVTEPGESDYDVGEVGFECGDLAWRLHSSFGTPDELRDVGAAIIGRGCEPTGGPARS